MGEVALLALAALAALPIGAAFGPFFGSVYLVGLGLAGAAGIRGGE